MKNLKKMKEISGDLELLKTTFEKLIKEPNQGNFIYYEEILKNLKISKDALNKSIDILNNNSNLLEKENELLKASENKVVFNEEFIKDKIQYINNSKSGKVVFTVGQYSCTYATKMELKRILEEKSYNVNFGINSHGVETLIVTW